MSKPVNIVVAIGMTLCSMVSAYQSIPTECSAYLSPSSSSAGDGESGGAWDVMTDEDKKIGQGRCLQ
jgi:hypothetical protein